VGGLLSRLLFVSLTAISLLLTRPAAAAKDELTIGITQFPSTFHPMIDAMLAKSYILAMTLRPFVIYDKDWQLVCMLCTELPTFENGKAKLEDLPGGKKGMAVSYTIQPNATWGDGVPVTTDDVMFAWEVGRNPKTGVPEAEPYLRVTKIDVHDRKSFTLHIDKVHFQYNSYFIFDPLPAHLDRKNFAEPENYARRSAYETDTSNPGLYYGPYRITQVVPGSHVVLEPNPGWYGAKPAFKRVTVRVIENTAALEANLLSGGIDYIAGELGLALDQALTFEKRHRDRFDIIYNPSLVYEHIDLNLDNPILKDKRVRQALLYGMDRDTLAKQLFEGRQPVAHSFVSPLDWIAAKDLPEYKYDPARAAALLDAAGWSKLQNGIRTNAAGERLALEIMTTAGNRTRETVEVVLQSQLKKIGVDLRVRNEPARVGMGATLRQRKFTGMSMYAWATGPENVPRSILNSQSIPTAANNYTGQNFTGFQNAEVDATIDRIEVELDRTKRLALWHRLQEIYMEELPVLPLYFRANPFVIPKWLTGIEPTGHSASTTYWIENWKSR
jgi:peptide/nickel transport system substrate-binding protein